MTDGLKIQNGVVESCTARVARLVIPEGVHTIGANAFKGCVSLEAVELPDSVTHIMEHAFKGCRQLREINFPGHLTHIGDYAFHRCHSLQQVRLPLSVKELGNCAFLFCDSLSLVSIPGVVRLGSQAFFQDLNIVSLEISQELDPAGIIDVFMGCSRLAEISFPGGEVYAPKHMLSLLSDGSRAPEVVKAVVRDVYRAMEMEDGRLVKFLLNLTHVEIPEGIRELGKSSFYDKKGIISVTLPKSLEYIDSRAFRNCTSLKTVVLGNDHLRISKDAFKNCTTLKYIRTADGVCHEMTGLAEAAGALVPEIVRRIHSQVLGSFFISGTMLIEYRGSEDLVVVPEGITVIGERAFAGNEAIGRVILPDSLTEIHQEAFADCLLLQRINVPAGLERLDDGAFEHCVKLIRVDLPDTLTAIGGSAFNRCIRLNEVQLGNGLEEIGAMAFYGCTALKNIRLPETLQDLGDMAFYKCRGLKEIALPPDLKRIGNQVFTHSGIRSAVVEGDISFWGNGVFSGCKKLRVLTLKDGVRGLGDRAAAGCPALKYVNLPQSLGYMGYRPLAGSLYEAELAEPVRIGNIFYSGQTLSGEITIAEGITGIAGGAFHGNETITAVHLPGTLISIGTAAFSGCIGLEQLVLPDGIDYLEEEVFAGCRSLTMVTAERNLKYIGKRAFASCVRLHKLECKAARIGEDAVVGADFLAEQREQHGLVVIGDIVVDGQYCSGSLSLPEGITGIAPFAFAGNVGIQAVELPKSLKNIGKGAFYGCTNLAAAGSGGADYKIEIIAAQAFAKCVSLNRLELNAVLAEEQAFAFCTGLKEVRMPVTTALGKEAFLGCGSLVRFEGPVLCRLGIRCFERCEALTGFTFKEHAVAAAHAFEDCTGLTAIQIAGQQISHESYAFSGCTALRTVQLDHTVYRLEGYRLLQDQSLPEPVKEIYQSALSCYSIDDELALYHCRSHGRQLDIPDGIRSIGREVFRNAMQLEAVRIPQSVTAIGARAFHSTPWLQQKSQEDPLVIINDILIHGADCEGDVRIPENVKMISGWAFANAYGLTSVSYASDHTLTGEYAFRNCINLREIKTADGTAYAVRHITDRVNPVYPPLVRQIIADCYNCFKTGENGILEECTGNISELVLAAGIRAIGPQVFKESNLLTRIRLAGETEVIGVSAFEQCKWLTSVTGAESVRRIEKRAFSGCIRMESIDLSENLEMIGPGAFEECISLHTIIIPEGVTDIPDQAFFRCRNLRHVSLPSTLRTIGREAFAYCRGLTIPAIPPGVSVGADAFRKAGSL